MYGSATGRFSFQLRQICIESLAWLAIVVGLDIMAGSSPVQSITTAMGLIPAFELTRILAKGMSLIVAGLVS
ncbi:hypothetical protein CHLRE_35g759297v5 [Chlamydomonas reinhardtii]|uniref:Uncharacterized protein n=1 Tax=Chlamydomonas reinhardtii TaxID=3055 RepID=A0A2K3CMV9_CHLRE|nr:uncharacterized protein CHLRE_35g759297v5 [Chlamydomonas reinhardtii]PNW69616.1 hypothetical protein CHLRE_35g759297v5 [Chlamydomonas reinhardtii]